MTTNGQITKYGTSLTMTSGIPTSGLTMGFLTEYPAAPSDANLSNITEMTTSGSGYARQNITLGNPVFDATLNAWVYSNTSQINFGPFTETGIVLAGWFITNGSIVYSVGKILNSGGTAITPNTNNNQTLYFAIGTLKVGITV